MYREPEKVADTIPPQTSSPEDRKQSGPPAKPEGRNKTILLAEDDREVRVLTRTVLEEFGYDVIEASDGQDAIDRFMADAEKIDLLILDVLMPKKSGKDVYDFVRSVRRDVAILFTSGFADDVIRTKSFADEGLRFMIKPVDPDALLQAVREVLDAKR